MSNKISKVLVALATAAAMAFALDALVQDTIGISGHSIVVGSLGSAGCLTVILAFASITGRNLK